MKYDGAFFEAGGKPITKSGMQAPFVHLCSISHAAPSHSDAVAAAAIGITLPDWQISRCGTVALIDMDCAAILACRQAGAPNFARWAIFAGLSAADIFTELRGLNS